MTPPSLPMRLAAEAAATGLLVAVGPGSAMIAARTGAFGHVGVCAAFGLVVALFIVLLGGVSAHANPAVTFACWLRGRLAGRDVLPYVAVQCAAAVLAALATAWVLGPDGGHGTTVPRLPAAAAFAVEFSWSALLMLVILRTTERSTPIIPPVAIGLTVFLGALVAGPLTGGSFNPARTLGPAVAAGDWTAHWLYWAAPTLGMLAAAVVFDRLVPEAPTDAR